MKLILIFYVFFKISAICHTFKGLVVVTMPEDVE